MANEERLEEVQRAGARGADRSVERLRSSVVGGIKHMPMRYKLAAARH